MQLNCAVQIILTILLIWMIVENSPARRSWSRVPAAASARPSPWRPPRTELELSSLPRPQSLTPSCQERSTQRRKKVSWNFLILYFRLSLVYKNKLFWKTRLFHSRDLRLLKRVLIASSSWASNRRDFIGMCVVLRSLNLVNYYQLYHAN